MRSRHGTPKRSPEIDVKAWNDRFPVGTLVDVKLDNDSTLRTKTRSEAQILSGHSAVIWVDGVTGCYLLGRVTPV